MEIRLAHTGDIPRMLALLDQVGGVHHEIRPDLFRHNARKYDEAALKCLLSDPERPIFAAVIDARMIGYAFCVLQVTQNNPVLRDRKVLYIDDLCVDETCRGQGIATALYQHVRSYARQQGCQAVTLNVWCGNHSAMGFYEKMGMLPRNITMEQTL